MVTSRAMRAINYVGPPYDEKRVAPTAPNITTSDLPVVPDECDPDLPAKLQAVTSPSYMYTGRSPPLDPLREAIASGPQVPQRADAAAHTGAEGYFCEPTAFPGKVTDVYSRRSTPSWLRGFDEESAVVKRSRRS